MPLSFIILDHIWDTMLWFHRSILNCLVDFGIMHWGEFWARPCL
jgi:hypothetical protein